MSRQAVAVSITPVPSASGQRRDMGLFQWASFTVDGGLKYKLVANPGKELEITLNGDAIYIFAGDRWEKHDGYTLSPPQRNSAVEQSGVHTHARTHT